MSGWATRHLCIHVFIAIGWDAWQSWISISQIVAHIVVFKYIFHKTLFFLLIDFKRLFDNVIIEWVGQIQNERTLNAIFSSSNSFFFFKNYRFWTVMKVFLAYVNWNRHIQFCLVHASTFRLFDYISYTYTISTRTNDVFWNCDNTKVTPCCVQVAGCFPGGALLLPFLNWV